MSTPKFKKGDWVFILNATQSNRSPLTENNPRRLCIGKIGQVISAEADPQWDYLLNVGKDRLFVYEDQIISAKTAENMGRLTKNKIIDIVNI